MLWGSVLAFVCLVPTVLTGAVASPAHEDVFGTQQSAAVTVPGLTAAIDGPSGNLAAAALQKSSPANIPSGVERGRPALSAAPAAFTNPPAGHGRLESSSRSPGQHGVLYCPSNRDNPDFRAALSALTGLPVDFIDTYTTTPTLETLMGYQVVMTWANYPYADKDLFGNNLADYVDAGGRVIFGQWCSSAAGNSLSGRIMTAEYCPALVGHWSSGSYNGDGVLCPTTGVTALSTDYLDIVTGLQPGAASDGTIGTSYVAIWRPDMAVWYSPGNMGGTYETGDWAALTYNEIVCLPEAPGACCDSTTAICLDNMAALDCIGMGAQWRWRLALCAELTPPCGNPGACCDIYTGLCTDSVLEALCEAEQFTGGAICGELQPACGNPGCCCDSPESGIITAPHIAYRANCVGRFVPQADGQECVAEMFDPACGLWYPTGVLYAPSNADNSPFRAALSALLSQPVDFLDTSYETPTVEMLSQYLAVFTWANYPYADNEEFGDRLADYVDGGGRVILGQWCYPTATNYLAGRIMEDPRYCPVMAASGWGAAVYSGDGILCGLSGVATLESSYVDIVTALQPGAMWDGTFGDSYVALWNAAMNVWYSPGNTGGTYETGDWALLTYDEITCRSVPGPCCNLFTAECIDTITPVACLDLGSQWRPYYAESCAALVPPCGDPGACCDEYSGACVDNVLEYNCEELGRQHTGGAGCEELPVPCGDPGCCCDQPEDGVVTEPHFAFHANCLGRFIAGAYTLCGDLDASGRVDFADYNMFLDAFGNCRDQAGFVAAADLDGDGCITMVDFQAWRNCYLYQGTDCTAAAFEPECGLQQIWFCLPPEVAPDPTPCGAPFIEFPEDPRPLYVDVTTLPTPCPREREILFDPPLNHIWLTGWEPEYPRDAYYTNGATSVELTIPPMTPGLTFQAEVNPFDTYYFTVLVNGAVESNPIPTDDSGTARICICSSEYSPIETVVITSDGIDFLLSEFGILCHITTGACCFEPTGNCTDDVASSDCSVWPGWEFHPDTRCDQLDPPCGGIVGACCYGEECVLQYISECTGEFQGADSSCDPNPCLCADFSIVAPGEWTGSTCGAGDDCGLRTGEEVIFAVTIPYEGKWTFSLCGSDSDTYWFFGYECCTQYWSQDDSTECGLAGYTQQDMTAGTYYIDLEGYSSCGSYVLTITPPPTGACCLTDSAECTDGLLELDCAGDRFEADTLCADLVPPCGTACWGAEIAAPGAWSGTTCGMGDDCALRAGEDVIVKVVIPSDGNWQFGLCGTATAWDTYMYLGTSCCQSTWYDDDGCGSALSRIQRPGLTAGTYYLDIEPYSSSVCGDLVLDVSNYEPARTAATHAAPRQFEQLRP